MGSEQGSGQGSGDRVLEKWFLSALERGNPTTTMDRRHPDGRAWTTGNRVEVLIHGASYFSRLHQELASLEEGALVCFTDWRGDPDERLDGEGTELGKVLAELARRGVAVRGLVWRSHPEETKFSEESNYALGEMVNKAGGQVLLDQRIRRGGCHHQKLVLIRHPGHEDKDVAFVGGIDLCHGRRDDERHVGDPQVIEMDPRFGPRPAWHDIQLELRGPVVGDLAVTFRERWEDPTPIDHRNPWRARLSRKAREPDRPKTLPSMRKDPDPVGPHVVQVLRTYPAKKPPFPFAPRGERSVARAYSKAFSRARRLIYLEDQYLWSDEVADFLAASLRRSPDLRLIAVVPRFPDRDGRMSGPPNRIGQEAALDRVRKAGGDRVEVYDLESETGWPIYVHAKVCLIDDVWAAAGSDNLNRRSWTHDSELGCAVMDETLDPRDPRDPAGQGDGARVFARNLRLRLWREHLGGNVPEQQLLDPVAGFELWRERAAALDRWNREGRKGERPPGRARVHRPVPVRAWTALWAAPAYRLAIDPDGRPQDLKHARRF